MSRYPKTMALLLSASTPLLASLLHLPNKLLQCRRPQEILPLVSRITEGRAHLPFTMTTNQSHYCPVCSLHSAGQDFMPATHTITFPPSPTPTQVCTSFDIINDTIGLEGNEMFTVRVELSGPESWVTIVDDDGMLVT